MLRAKRGQRMLPAVTRLNCIPVPETLQSQVRYISSLHAWLIDSGRDFSPRVNCRTQPPEVHRYKAAIRSSLVHPIRPVWRHKSTHVSAPIPRQILCPKQRHGVDVSSIDPLRQLFFILIASHPLLPQLLHGAVSSLRPARGHSVRQSSSVQPQTTGFFQLNRWPICFNNPLPPTNESSAYHVLPAREWPHGNCLISLSISNSRLNSFRKFK